MRVCVGECDTNLKRFVEKTGSSSAVQEVVVLLHIAVREPLGQVETVQHNHNMRLLWIQYRPDPQLILRETERARSQKHSTAKNTL